MRPTKKISHMRSLTGCACALLLLVCASVNVVASAQEEAAGHRLAASRTSEDLLGRRAFGTPAPGSTGIAPSSLPEAVAAAASLFDRHPAAASSLTPRLVKASKRARTRSERPRASVASTAATRSSEPSLPKRS